MSAEENKAIIRRWIEEAWNKGNLLGIAPTGKQVEFTAVDIWRFESGKIVERCRANVDRLGLMQQLGVIPQMGQTS